LYLADEIMKVNCSIIKASNLLKLACTQLRKKLSCTEQKAVQYDPRVVCTQHWRIYYWRYA